MTSPAEPISGKMQNDIPLPYNFKISSVLEEAWDRIHGAKATYWGAIFFFLLFYFLLGCALAVIAVLMLYTQLGTFNTSTPLFQTHISLSWNLTWFLLSPLYAGVFYIGILRASNQPIQSEAIFSPFKKTLKIWGTFIFTFLSILGVVFIGYFLIAIVVSAFKSSGLDWMASAFGLGMVIITFIASFYLAFAFMFAPLLVFEKNLGVYRAMKASLVGFSQHWFKILILQAAMFIIIMISSIPLGVGLIWTLPMAINLFGVIYRTIFGVEKKR